MLIGHGGIIGASGVAAAGGPSYLIEENFEGTGAPTGWSEDVTSGGTINWDSTTTPLRGSQSLRLSRTGSPGVAVSKTFTAQSEVHVFLRLKWSTTPTENYQILALQDASNNNIAQLFLRSAGSLRIYHGTTVVSASTTPTAGTLYYMWISWVAGTGSDGVMTLHFGTSETKPGTAEATISTGTATADAAKLVLLNYYLTGDIDYDQIVVAETEIGNVDS